MTHHPTDALGPWLDGELPPEEARRVADHLERCTECAREAALIRTLGGAMRANTEDRTPPSAWEGVHRRLTRPAGWILLAGGAAVWAALALVGWFRQALTLEWLAATAVGAGLLVLLVAIGHEQYREWKDSPYRDIER